MGFLVVSGQKVANFYGRGEALSALCQISASLTVCTRTLNESTGSLLEFSRSGSLISKVGNVGMKAGKPESGLLIDLDSSRLWTLETVGEASWDHSHSSRALPCECIA